MEHTLKQERSVLAELQHGGGRSQLFWWLVDHHDEVANAAAGQRIMWHGFARSMARLGMTDINGKPPTPIVCRRTWHRARVFVAARRASTATLTVDVADPRARIPRSASARPVLAERYSPPATNEHQAAVASNLGSFVLPPSAMRSGEESQGLSQEALEAAAIAIRAVPAELIASSIRPVTALCVSRDVAVPSSAELPAENAVRKSKWTPAQQARIDASKASAWAQLDHADRFINLKE